MNSEAHLQSISEVEEHFFWHQVRFSLVSKLLEKFAHLFPRYLIQVDLGAGNLGLVRFLNQRGFHFWGVDQHPYQPRAGENYLQLNLNTNFHLPNPAGLIVATDVIEHLDNDEVFLQTVAQNLSTLGLCVLTAPAFMHLYSDWDRHLGHRRRYTKSELVEKLKKQNFEILFVSYFFKFLYPLAIFRIFFPPKSAQFPKLPSWANALFTFLGKFEIWFITHCFSLPWGTSLVVVAQKKDRPQ